MFDAAARQFAERQIRDRAGAAYPEAAVEARIEAARFLGPLVRRGTVSDIAIHVTGVTVGGDDDPVILRSVHVALHEVRVRRLALLAGRVELADLGSGRVEVEVDGPSLAARVGLPLVFHDDEVELRAGVGPLAVSTRGSLTVEADTLRFRPGRIQGFPLLVSMDFTWPLPVSTLWPAAATARSVEGGVLLACDLEDLPPALVHRVGVAG